MSARPSICLKVGMYWNSMCTTSGAPEPALSAVRSFWYSSSPCPAFTSLTLMFLWAFSNMSTWAWKSGSHAHNVSSTGPDELPPPQPARPPMAYAPASAPPPILRKSFRVRRPTLDSLLTSPPSEAVSHPLAHRTTCDRGISPQSHPDACPLHASGPRRVPYLPHCWTNLTACQVSAWG